MGKLTSCIKSFGIYYTFVAGINSISNKIFKNSKLSHLLHHYKYRLVSQYLLKKYGYIIERSKKEKYENRIGNSNYIWICWWQGLENAPKLVKACVANIQKKYGKEKHIVIVDKHNYDKYVDIPFVILNKVQKGNFPLTFLADILRFCLLDKYGGIWIDATVFLNKKISIDQYCFFSIKHNLYTHWHVCRGKWSTFFIASGANNTGVSIIKEILLAYAKNENTLMAYLLLDAVIGIVYDKVDVFKKQVDDVPVNNDRVFLMQHNLNTEIDQFQIPADINKLSYKFKYKSKINGKETVYGYILQMLN